MTKQLTDHQKPDGLLSEHGLLKQIIKIGRNRSVAANNLCFLRHYQKKAKYALQRAIKDGKDRFLFEMATGTGKTLTTAAVIKLFLRTGNAQRVLFLVDRLELMELDKCVFTSQKTFCPEAIRMKWA